MNSTKKINVNFSSLIGLKAELLRKQTEVNEAKMRSQEIHAVPKTKKKPKKPKEKNTDRKSEELTDIDDIKTHKKSKLMLEAKARLYNRLKKAKNNHDNFLVDFSNKSDESEDELPKSESESDTMLDNDEDGWVEYVDCFGRTRRCLCEDLPFMQEKDDLLKHQIMKKKNSDIGEMNNINQTVIEEKEPEIEVMRRKWEEQTQKLADKVNIHYQDVLFDEARAHGVGYYAFSQDEENRLKQQENLANLRKDTEQKQKEMKELKELRSKMEQNRLKAAQIRKRIRAGLPAEPTEAELEERKESVEENIPSVTESTETKPDVIEDDRPVKNKEESVRIEDEATIREDKIKAFSKLLGKKTHWYEMSQEEWVDKCRKARITEFGPVYENFESAGYLKPEENAESNINSNSEAVASTSLNSVESAINGSMLSATTEESRTVVQSTQNIENSESDNILLPEISQDVATSNGKINEDSIMAGLKYLRERFEKNHNP